MHVLRYLSLASALILLLIVPAHAEPAAEELVAEEPFIVYDVDGTVLYEEGVTEESTSEFLTKPFEKYTVVEGYLLLFFLLAFIGICWTVVRGVF